MLEFFFIDYLLFSSTSSRQRLQTGRLPVALWVHHQGSDGFYGARCLSFYDAGKLVAITFTLSS